MKAFCPRSRHLALLLFVLASATEGLAVPGDLDLSFNKTSVSGGDFQVSAVLVQPDGKILFGGNFTTVNGQARNGIARLEANGILESAATFNPGTGIAGYDDSMALQADGKILLGGSFIRVNGQSRSYLARLHADGALEAPVSFNAGTSADGVWCVTVQADGKILVGGHFTTVNGQTRNRIARLNADGTLENSVTFNPSTGVRGAISDAISEVRCVAVQADGKILLGGEFTGVDGQPRNRIARLNPDGTVESTTTFNTGSGADGIVNSFALQADGKILLGGYFTTVNSQPRKGYARLNGDGSLEGIATFNPAAVANNGIRSIALQADGKILLGGYFSNGIARLSNDPAIQLLTIPNRTQVLWKRGGSAPEVCQVTFELSTNAGANWNLLGSGTRTNDGWALSGLSLPL